MRRAHRGRGSGVGVEKDQFLIAVTLIKADTDTDSDPDGLCQAERQSLHARPIRWPDGSGEPSAQNRGNCAKVLCYPDNPHLILL